jgi:hypothetical protein
MRRLRSFASKVVEPLAGQVLWLAHACCAGLQLRDSAGLSPVFPHRGGRFYIVNGSLYTGAYGRR